MGATLSAATCTIFGPTFPVQSNAITLRFAHRRLGPKLIAVAAQLTKIKYSHLHRPVTHSLYSWPIWGRAGAAGNDFSWLRPNALALASCHIPCTVVLENLLMARTHQSSCRVFGSCRTARQAYLEIPVGCGKLLKRRAVEDTQAVAIEIQDLYRRVGDSHGTPRATSAQHRQGQVAKLKRAVSLGHAALSF